MVYARLLAHFSAYLVFFTRLPMLSLSSPRSTKNWQIFKNAIYDEQNDHLSPSGVNEIISSTKPIQIIEKNQQTKNII